MAAKSNKSNKSNKSEQPVRAAHDSVRETVESVVIAVILAFLFRGFVAEAFVIPTGSMAPTLQGRHIDFRCPQCDFRFLTGASLENRDSRPPRICRRPGYGQRDEVHQKRHLPHVPLRAPVEPQPSHRPELASRLHSQEQEKRGFVQRRPDHCQQVRLPARLASPIRRDRLQIPRKRQAKLHQAADRVAPGRWSGSFTATSTPPTSCST